MQRKKIVVRKELVQLRENDTITGQGMDGDFNSIRNGKERKDMERKDKTRRTSRCLMSS